MSSWRRLFHFEPRIDQQVEEILKSGQEVSAAIAAAAGAVAEHVGDKANPHQVTVEQIGAETPTGAQAKVEAHAMRIDNPHDVTYDQTGAAAAEHTHDYLPSSGGTVFGDLAVLGALLISGQAALHLGNFDIAILTGTVAHGGTIPLPTGFTQEQCRWFVSINTLTTCSTATQDGTFGVSADANRVVTCRYRASGGETRTGTANYLIIGIKRPS